MEENKVRRGILIIAMVVGVLSLSISQAAGEVKKSKGVKTTLREARAREGKKVKKTRMVPELSDFETQADIDKWTKGAGAAMELSTEHVTQGKYSCKVKFTRATESENYLRLEYPGFASNDWSDYGMLVFDIYNPNDFPIRLAFSLDSLKGNLIWDDFGIEPHKMVTRYATLLLPLQYILVDEDWAVNAVTRIAITDYSHLPDVEMFIDNIRLLSKEETHKTFDYPVLSPDDLGKVHTSSIPVGERDFVYAPSLWDTAFQDPDFKARCEKAGLWKAGYGTVELLYPGWMIVINPPFIGWPMQNRDPKLTLIPEFQALAVQKMPFTVHIIGGWYFRESYELLMQRARTIIDWAEEICGEYFLGVEMWEMHGVTAFKAVTKAKTRIEKADAYVGCVRKIIDDLNLSPGKLFITVHDSSLNYGLEYEAGADIVGDEMLQYPKSTSMLVSEARGMARSFRKLSGMFSSLEMGFGKDHDPETGRYNPGCNAEFKHWRLQKPGDVYKLFLHNYYAGLNYLFQYQPAAIAGPNITPFGEAASKFLSFVESNPRCKDVISKVAVVRSKGDYMRGFTHLGKDEQAPHFNQCVGLGRYISGEGIKKEEADFLYLNSFFPGFTDDLILGGYWWNSTPYGAVDIIYPAMKLKDMKKYNSIIFLGYHRMDSVREDFLNDLMKYVNGGGTVLLSVDQLMDKEDRFNAERLDRFLGARVSSKSTSDLSGRRKIKDYLKVTQSTPFGLEKKRYPISAEVKLWGEKERWVYRVNPKWAKVVAKDSQGVPLLLLNRYGKGYVLLFTSPTLSMIPPEGKSAFVSEVIDRVCRYKPLPVSISPGSDNVEFLISTTKDKEATVFVMNHGEKDWSGEIVVNLKEAGLSPQVVNNVSCKVVTNYDNIREVEMNVTQEGDNVIIKGISLQGDKGEFCSYRQASFALVRLKGE